MFTRSIFPLIRQFLSFLFSPIHPLVHAHSSHIQTFTHAATLFFSCVHSLYKFSHHARVHTHALVNTHVCNIHTPRARARSPFLPIPLSILHSRMDSLESSEAADRFFGTHRAQSRHDETRKLDVIGHYLLLFCSSLYIRSNSCVYVYMCVRMVRMFSICPIMVIM